LKKEKEKYVKSVKTYSQNGLVINCSKAVGMHWILGINVKVSVVVMHWIKLEFKAHIIKIKDVDKRKECRWLEVRT